MIGRTLGHYQVLEKIGQGGMGVVYSAQDSNLHRPVALKLLPDAFSSDPEYLARFKREATLLASLNNPNIAAIYGLEQADNRCFLVLELVAGETLAQRIAKGPLPVDETLEVCRQIAEGLEAAHEKGVIHRDLKPANVKITPEGKVKVLDFGLAKALHEGPAQSDASDSPTITDQMTRPGVILGTAAYMSPEQAKGKAVDKRTDIWAFGCVLFECLTGKRAFEGETVTETLASIMKGEPEWKLLPHDTPVRVRDVLKRCLQKDPKERIHDVADAWLEIKAEPVPAFGEVTGSRRLSILWMAAGAAVLLFAGVLLGRFLTGSSQPAPATPVIRSIIKIQPGHWLDGSRRNQEGQRPTRIAMALSGAGRFVVYSAIAENPGPQAKPQLYLRRLDQLEAKPIAGTEGGIHPFLSPDDRWVGFWAAGYLNKIPIEGDTPATRICSATDIYGASWHDDSIVFSAGPGTGLSRVSADGGKPEPLTTPDPKREESSHRLPSWLPGGRAVLFTVMRHGWDTQPWVALLQLDSREWRMLLQDAADARYVPMGHLVFLRQGTLMAVRFDPDKFQILGQPSSVANDVVQALDGFNTLYHSGAGQLAVSKGGSILYAAGGMLPPAEQSLVWVDQQGNEQPAVPLRFPFFAPRLSPDGQRIAYGTTGREWKIWVYDLGSGTNTPLTSEGEASYPVWAPDGKRLVFNWHKALAQNLFAQAFDGSSPMERLTTAEHSQFPGSWSRDGATIALAEQRPDTGYDIAVLDSRSGRVSPFLNSSYAEMYPEFSPDGRWMAYSSNESGRSEVYIRPFPGPGGKWQVSANGGIQPLWSKNGKQLFYRWQDQVWVVEVQTDGGFSIGNRRMLFERPGYIVGGPIRSYDLSLDGQRFLMVKMDTRKPAPLTEMILVQNWFEELKRLVPTGKN